MTSPNPTGNFTPFSNAAKYFSAQVPVWVGNNVDDRQRVMAYMFYERLYWNVPDTLTVVQRGEDSVPVYLPSARGIVEACNRFLAIGWDYAVDTKQGSPSDQQAVSDLFKQLFIREEMQTKFTRQKRYGLIRGDAVWHLIANSLKPAGQRISVYEVDPTHYFPILADQNPDRVIGCHLVDLIPDPRNETKQVARRQTYMKVTGDWTGPSQITSELAIFELGKWDDRIAPSNVVPIVEEVLPWDGKREPFTLPDSITSLPVYHVKNQGIPCFGFGSSELRGIESVISAVDQAISDEDIALAMQGLGVYASTAGPPTSADGTPGTFDLGPGQVVEVPQGESFTRVSGISSGLPGIEHMNFMLNQTQQAIGIPDVATGTVDVAVAESGIALRLKLAPLLSHNKEKEVEMLSRYNQMFYDLVNGWFPAYEDLSSGTQVVITAKVDDPIPEDKAAKLAAILQMVQSVPPLMSTRTALAELAKLGYEIPADELDQLTKEAQARTAMMQLDPFAQRALGEFAGPVSSASNAKPPAPSGGNYKPPVAPAPQPGVKPPVAPAAALNGGGRPPVPGKP